MGTKIRPIVYKISNDAEGLKEFHKDLTEDAPEERQNIILQYPIVYIHNWQSTGEYEVYVGESNNIIQRTK